jgi:hypothetical protein
MYGLGLGLQHDTKISSGGGATLTLTKVWFTRGTHIWKMDPDGTNLEDVFTAAATVYSIAVDHVNSRVLYNRVDNETIRYISFDGTGDTLLLTSITNLDVFNNITVDETNSRVVWGALGRVRDADLATGGDQQQLSTQNPGGIFYSYYDNKIYYTLLTGTDELKVMDVGGGNETTLFVCGGTTRSICANSVGVFGTDTGGNIKYTGLDGVGDKTWFTSSLLDLDNICVDWSTGQLWATSSSTTGTRGGIFLFDGEVPNSDHSTTVADFALNSAITNHGISLQFNQSPVGLVV